MEFKGTKGKWKHFKKQLKYRKMEFKGTKGKWKHFKKTDYWVVCDMTGASVVIQAKSSCSSPYHAEANALLISKSPEMLELLIKAKSTISRLKNSMLAHPDCIYGSEFDDYTNLADDCENEIEQLIKQATEL